MTKTARIFLLALMASATLPNATSASATITLTPPDGANDIEFVFPDGQCQNRIVLAVGEFTGGYVLTNYGCGVGDVLKYTWQTSGTISSFNLYGVVSNGSPEAQARPTIPLVDAYWTRHDSISTANIGSVWKEGASNYSVLLPEPTTWLLMLSGIALLGARIRLGKRRTFAF